MTENQPDGLLPEASDFRRAGALVNHRFNGDSEGGNAVMLEAFDEQRVPELVLALVELTAFLAVAATPSGETVVEWWPRLVARFAEKENR